jgi:hypothetical protein
MRIVGRPEIASMSEISSGAARKATMPPRSSLCSSTDFAMSCPFHQFEHRSVYRNMTRTGQERKCLHLRKIRGDDQFSVRGAPMIWLLLLWPVIIGLILSWQGMLAALVASAVIGSSLAFYVWRALLPEPRAPA